MDPRGICREPLPVPSSFFIYFTPFLLLFFWRWHRLFNYPPEDNPTSGRAPFLSFFFLILSHQTIRSLSHCFHSGGILSFFWSAEFTLESFTRRHVGVTAFIPRRRLLNATFLHQSRSLFLKKFNILLDGFVFIFSPRIFFSWGASRFSLTVYSSLLHSHAWIFHNNGLRCGVFGFHITPSIYDLQTIKWWKNIFFVTRCTHTCTDVCNVLFQYQQCVDFDAFLTTLYVGERSLWSFFLMCVICEFFPDGICSPDFSIHSLVTQPWILFNANRFLNLQCH